MKLAIASDHAGFELKEYLKTALNQYEIVDYGTNSATSMDYPNTGKPAAMAVASGACDKAILICGSGIGMSITANKIKGIRAALCFNTDFAKLSRMHNDANIIVLPGRFIAAPYALEMVQIWLDTQFEGGRHQNRLDKIE